MAITVEEIIDSVLQKQTNIPEKEKTYYRDMLCKIFIEKKTVFEASNMDKNILEAAYLIAYNKYQTGNFQEALDLFFILFNYHSKDPRFPLGAGACHHKLGNYKDAVAYYYGVAMLDPESPLPYYYMSDCFIKMNTPKTALIILDIMLYKAKMKPDFYAPIIERGELTFNQLLEETGVKIQETEDENVLETFERLGPIIAKRIDRIKNNLPIKPKKKKKPSAK